METRDASKYRKYTKLRNQVRHLTRKNREMDIASQVKSNPKKFWAYVNSKTKTKSCIPDLLYTQEGVEKLTLDDKDKAEVLSKFFASVYTTEPDGSTPKLDSPVLDVNIDSLAITPEIVLKKLHGLNPIKSLGVDEIHPKVLKELENEYVTL